MSNEKELKKDVIPYLNERIERQKNLVKIARKKDNKRMEDIHGYGIDLLTGIKRDISK